jgi:metal-responsive CopG/Arc/MetJ family transcriptional regulator
MVTSKIKVGVALDKAALQKIDEIDGSSTYLDTNRSEIIGTILSAFFKSEVNHTEKARGLIIRKRKELP